MRRHQLVPAASRVLQGRGCPLWEPPALFLCHQSLSSLPLPPAALATGLAEVGAGGPAGWEHSEGKGRGAARLAGAALRAGLDTQALLTEKWEELCSQLSEPSGRLGALEQTQNIAGRIARRGLRCRKPLARTDQGGWD